MKFEIQCGEKKLTATIQKSNHSFPLYIITDRVFENEDADLINISGVRHPTLTGVKDRLKHFARNNNFTFKIL